MRDDLVAAGNVGLVEAAQRFHPGRDTNFEQFSYLRIRGSIIDALRIYRELGGKQIRLLKALESAHATREVNFLDSLAPFHQGKVTPRSRALHGAQALLSFCLASHGLEATEVSDTHNPEHALKTKQWYKALEHALDELPERERFILQEYYFEDKSFVEIGNMLDGASKSWICRLHARALERLRKHLAPIREEA
jgi:RNA polymerase sigma factor FliA